MDNGRKQGFLLEDYRLFHLSSPQGITTELHYHEFCKILLLIRGRGDYILEGRRYRLRPGDIVLLPPGTVHRAEMRPEEPYERIILYILPSFLEGLSTASSQLVEIFTHSPVLRPGDDRLTRLALKLERALETDGFGKDLLCQAELTRLLVHLARCPGLSPEPKPLSPQDPRVGQLLAFLDDHFTEDVRIDDLAQRFFLSKYHMMRLFRQETGVTIHQYITQKRLLLARSYLASGRSATDSCYQSGFGSYSAFTRASRKLLGVTPTGKGQTEVEE